MAKSTVMSTKGRVTIPRAVRERRGLKEGDGVESAIDRDHVVIRPVRTQVTFEPYMGALGTFGSGRHRRVVPGTPVSHVNKVVGLIFRSFRPAAQWRCDDGGAISRSEASMSSPIL